MYWTIGILGLALIVAPFVLGYSGDTNALWTSIILGAVVALVAGYKALTKDVAKWEDWVAGIAGLLAVIAPFVLFSAQTTAVWTSVILGLVVAILAGYQVFFVKPKPAPSEMHEMHEHEMRS